MLPEESVCFAKMTTAQKSAVCRERGGVRCFEYDMFVCIDERFLFLSMASPEQKYQKISFFWEGFYDSICEIFPSFSCVWHGLTSTDRECRIEKENALFCPASEVSVFRSLDTEISLNFLKYIHEWWWISDSFHDRKREPMSLSWTVIGVLPENNYFDVFKWSIIKGWKNIFWMRVNRLTRKNFVFYKTWKSLKIWFFKFIFESFFPAVF